MIQKVLSLSCVVFNTSVYSLQGRSQQSYFPYNFLWRHYLDIPSFINFYWLQTKTTGI